MFKFNLEGGSLQDKKDKIEERKSGVLENIEKNKELLEQIERDCFIVGLSYDQITNSIFSKIEEGGLSPEYSIDRDKTARFLNKVSVFFDKKSSEEFFSHFRLNEWIGGVLAKERLIEITKGDNYAEDYLFSIQNTKDEEKLEKIKQRAEELRMDFIAHNIKNSELEKIVSFIEKTKKEEGSVDGVATSI